MAPLTQTLTPAQGALLLMDRVAAHGAASALAVDCRWCVGVDYFDGIGQLCGFVANAAEPRWLRVPVEIDCSIPKRAAELWWTVARVTPPIVEELDNWGAKSLAEERLDIARLVVEQLGPRIFNAPGDKGRWRLGKLYAQIVSGLIGPSWAGLPYIVDGSIPRAEAWVEWCAGKTELPAPEPTSTQETDGTSNS